MCSSAFADGGSGTRNTRNDASAEYDVKHHSVQGAPQPLLMRGECRLEVSAGSAGLLLKYVAAACWPYFELLKVRGAKGIRSPTYSMRTNRPARLLSAARAYYEPEGARGGFKGTGALGRTGAGLPGRHRHSSSCWIGPNWVQAAEAPA